MIVAAPLPPHALLARHAAAGAYTDCYAVDLPAPVEHARYVEAFYTSLGFRPERWLLKLALGKGATDEDARQLALGHCDTFAAWRVEARAPEQLLLCDTVGGRTRSWLMVEPLLPTGTRLYFGSAVVPQVDRATGARRMGWTFAALLGFHRLYSRLLLGAARARLVDTQKQ